MRGYAAVRAAQDMIWARDPAFLPLVTPYRYRLHTSRVHNMPSGIGTSHLWLTTMWLAVLATGAASDLPPAPIVLIMRGRLVAAF